MDASTLTVKQLFQKDVRYVVPTFQRPYVWDQEDQWEPLWDDVRNTAESYLEILRSCDGEGAQAEEQTRSHFLGAVVLQQLATASADIEARQVIDGQQRMTTLQLLIDAAQEVLESIEAKTEAKRLQRLVLNSYADGDDQFKLWPTKLDRDPFRAAMTNGVSIADFRSKRIVQAHEFFKLQIAEWLSSSVDDDEKTERIHGLETTLFGLLEMVVIDLGNSDDSFIIFETLNARGTPLLASDLIKNFVMQISDSEGVKPEDISERYWKTLEDDWWRKDIRQGRIVRPRIDVFLNYWLALKITSDVSSHEVFPKFQDYAKESKKPMVEIASDIDHFASTYRAMDTIDPYSEEGMFFYRWRVMDAGVVTPVLLWLFSKADSQLPGKKRIRTLRAIESYLVRRMVCRMTTKDYNRMFIDMAVALQKRSVSEGDEAIISFLATQKSESRLWPDDNRMKQALSSRLEAPLDLG